MLSQQVLRAGIADILGIVNIADIADIADIGTDIADISTDIADICYAVRYLVPISTGNWARYVDRIRSQVRTKVD